MSRFSADWLQLREPYDGAARSAAGIDVLARLAHLSELHVVDLGSGTGANLRHLAPRLGGRQRWLLVDDDPLLLDLVGPALEIWAAARGARIDGGRSGMAVQAAGFECRVCSLRLDVGTGLDRLELAAGCLVTASALLDLVGETWLQTLAGRCRAAHAPVLFALNYDGRIQFAPADVDDAWIGDLINRHQRRDKGFGTALGPAAAAAAERLFSAAGYAVERARSDWHIEPQDAAMQHALLDGWCAAARELEPGAAGRIGAWSDRRARHIDDGLSRLRVGHEDLFARAP